jgi:hypothetical protein
LLWATPSLAHPFKIEVILSKRVDVLPKQRGREAQNIVVDHLAFGAKLADWTGRPPSLSWPLLTLGNWPHSGA